MTRMTDDAMPKISGKDTPFSEKNPATYYVCEHGMRVDFYCRDCEMVAFRSHVPRLLKDRRELRAKVELLESDIQAERDMKDDARNLILLIAESLGVEYEPHQTFNERLLEAATPKPGMKAVAEALGFDPSNHHNAAACPYCTPESCND